MTCGPAAPDGGGNPVEGGGDGACTLNEADGLVQLVWTAVAAENDNYSVRRNGGFEALVPAAGNLAWSTNDAQPGDSFLVRSREGGVTVDLPCGVAVAGPAPQPVLLQFGSLGNGNSVPGSDGATGPGWIMWSDEAVSGRFGRSAAWPTHLIAVRYNAGQWEYDTNTQGYVPFAPAPGDFLVAAIDSSADTAQLLAGVNTTTNGIATGFVSSDLVITPNVEAGVANSGEWGLAGTQVLAHP